MADDGEHDIGHNFGADELHKIKEVFKRFDTNGDHTVDTFELRAALQDVGHNATEEELVAIIKKFDTKGTGCLTFDDFTRVCWQQKIAAMREVSADIDTVDAFVAMGGNPDKTGSIVAARLIEVCREFQLTIDIEEMIRETDTDGSGFIDYDEFSLMLND